MRARPLTPALLRTGARVGYVPAARLATGSGTSASASRVAVTGQRRGYRASSRLLNQSRSAQGADAASSGWSSGSVLAVAAAAAVSGWGVASLVSREGSTKSKAKDDENGDEGGSVVAAVDSEDEEVGFANRHEMQEVIWCRPRAALG